MIRRLLRKFIMWGIHDDSDDSIPMPAGRDRSRAVTSKDNSVQLSSTGMLFHLYAAQGGTVIETSNYDQKQDRIEHRLYIIPEGEDFTSTLGQIVSLARIQSWH